MRVSDNVLSFTIAQVVTTETAGPSEQILEAAKEDTTEIPRVRLIKAAVSWGTLIERFDL